MSKNNMSFNYQNICSSFLKDLPQRTADIFERRFGLKTGKRETLESIGQTYEITRERVRQIEEEGFSKIRPKIEIYSKVFQYLNDTLEGFGGLKKEDALLNVLGGKKSQNQAYLLLTLADGLERVVENDDFYTFWAKEKSLVNLAGKVVDSTLKKFDKEKKPLSLEELYRVQGAEFSKFSKKINKDILNSYLEISKKIEENPEGRLGPKDWLEINPRGVKDKAYLVFRKEGKPLHFADVAFLIDKLPFPCQRKTHVATVHNELIKDGRFVLVGRGMYALKEWGYEPGVVKDIIIKTLKDSRKPLAKREILEKVLKQRLVKENTISLNLQDKTCFSRNPQGKYTIKEA